MASKNTSQRNKLLLWSYFFLFAIFILLGVLAKRLWGHTELLIPLHVTGGLFLTAWAYHYFYPDL